jgi:hypothetical protein
MTLLDKRERVLRCLNAIFEGNLGNTTHTRSAFEILFSMLIETPGTQTVLDTVQGTLDIISTWIQQGPKDPHTTENREARLKEGTLFSRLILACNGESDRAIVNKFRRDLDRHIGTLLGSELDKRESPMQNPQYPYLVKFMALSTDS